MKRSIALLITLVLFAAGCASTKKLAGRYGLVLDDELKTRGMYALDETVIYALREELGHVDLIDSPSDAGYDAVIVLSRGPWTQLHIEPQPEQPAMGTRQHLVQYEILRGGRKIAEGVARVERSWPPAPGERLDTDSHRHQQSYAGGLEVARVVVKALRDAG